MRLDLPMWFVMVFSIQFYLAVLVCVALIVLDMVGAWRDRRRARREDAAHQLDEMELEQSRMATQAVLLYTILRVSAVGIAIGIGVWSANNSPHAQSGDISLARLVSSIGIELLLLILIAGQTLATRYIRRRLVEIRRRYHDHSDSGGT